MNVVSSSLMFYFNIFAENTDLQPKKSKSEKMSTFEICAGLR